MSIKSEPKRSMSSVDHRRAPLIEGIRAYAAANIVPFSTPGHKRGAGIDQEFGEIAGQQFLSHEIPLGGGVDDTHFHGDTLEAAERLGADAWGADRTFYLVNGSSAGNQALLLGALRPGDKIIVARDIHKSLLVAMILSGVQPVYVAPRLHPEWEVGLGVDPQDVAAALDAHPDAKLVALVSPSYCGAPSDLAAIAAIAHARGVPVYVDEAWGPHFHFHPALPASAMSSGIDAATASTHKILGALTQSSILNIRTERLDAGRIKSAVDMVQTTSPMAMIFASIDACRRQMALDGEMLLDRAISLANVARQRLQALPGVRVMDAESLGLPHYDLTKLVIDVHGLGLTGFEVEHAMRHRFALQPEMSDLVSCVCVVTLADTEASINQLVGAFATLSRECSRNGNKPGPALPRSSGIAIAPGIQAMTPRDAFFAVSRAVPLEAAAGEVSAELVIPYPPGIPVLAPGDVIPADKIAYLRDGVGRGMYMSGPSDPKLRTIRIVNQG